MTFHRRQLWYVISLVIVVVLLFRMLRPERITVEVAAAIDGPLIESVGDEGLTQVRHRHLISAPVTGRLERITVDVGDRIAAGTVVARLAPLPLDARSRHQAEAALEASRDLERQRVAAVEEARNALEQAKRDASRAERLATGGALAPADLERIQLAQRTRAREVEAAEAGAMAAAHDVESAQSALLASGTAAGGRPLLLECPVGGVVLAIPERSERTVQPGQLLMEVGDPTDLEIVVDLLSTDAVKVMPGQPVLVSGWGGDSTLKGRVRRVDPAGFTKVSALGVEEQRVNIYGDFVAPTAHLGDRFRVDVRLVLWQSDRVLKVPASALFRRGDRWVLFVVEVGRAHERSVTVGHESASEAEITAGLRRGELVIRHPTDRVRDGSRVTYSSSGP